MKVMKLKRKYKALVLSFVLVAFISITNMMVGATNVAKMSIDPIGEISPGDEFTLTIKLQDSEDCDALGFKLFYDNTAFEVKSRKFLTGKYGEDPDSGEQRATKTSNVAENKIIFAFASLNPGNYYENINGTLATVTFKAKDTAVGEYDFRLSMDRVTDNDEYFKTESNNVQRDLELETSSTKVKVKVDATDINVSSSSLDLIKGNSTQLTVSSVPSKVTTPRNMSVSVTPSGVVNVDDDGNVEAIGNGSATISVTAYGITKTIPVTVTNPITGISLDQTSLELGKGDTYRLTATITPNDTSESKDITWTSSDDRIASVSSDGTVTAVGDVGDTKATIRATSSNSSIYAECVVDIVIPITSVSMDETPITLNKGETKQLSFTYEPSNTTQNKTITWESSDPTAATVTNGKVTAVKGGTTTITASMLNKKWTKSVEITVEVGLNDITVAPTSVELLPNQEQQITATFDPFDATHKDITWTTANSSVATVDTTGKITAVAPGATTITATYQTLTGQKTKDISVKVLIPITGVTIKPNSNITINKGETTTLSVEVTPANAEEDKTVTWSSDHPEIASVNASTGVVTGNANGTAIITGTLKNGKTVTANITVHVPVSSVTLNQNTLNLNKGDTYNGLVATINPSDSTIKTIAWSTSDAAVASVDTSTGVITAVADGTAIITATIEGKSATVTVTVTTAVTSVSIDQGATKAMVKGDTDTLIATVLPNDATDKTVSWSSDKPSVVTVDNHGNISAVGGGTATITAKAGTKTASITISVRVPITRFDLAMEDQNPTILRGVKNAKTLTTIIGPEDATDDRTITWSSSDSTIATVDSTGKVTGLKEGTVTITGKLNSTGATVTSNVTIQKIDLTGIKVELESDDILKGRDYQVMVTPIPENSTEFENIEYTSSDEDIFIVSSDGILTGVKEGTAMLTVTVKGPNPNGRAAAITEEIEVHVREISLEGINIVPIPSGIQVGETAQIELDLIPENVTDYMTITYKSSDESIATVDENGVITGLKEGTVKIIVTVQTEYGKEFTSEMEVKITKPEVSPKTSVESTSSYMILSTVSIVLIGGLVLTKRKMKKVK